MKINRRRKIAIAAGVFVVMIGAAVIFKTAILQALGSHLTVQTSTAPTPYLVILGGNSFERGSAALPWIEDGRAAHIICTGGNVPSSLLALDTLLTEAQLTKRFLVARGVPPDRITLLENNTSTFEEAATLKAWCAAHGVEQLTLLSSLFHLRRVRNVFTQVFEGTNVNLTYAAAAPLNYNPEFWWQSEEGLIMVNNEYMKHLYYWWKY
jgi:uncharacterized SAM-binding protein YcdF (DUF218 family)